MARHADFTQPVFDNIPDGKHPAIIFQMIDLGGQPFSKGEREWYSPQMLIGFEIPGLTFEGKSGETLTQIKSVTVFVSLNPSRNNQIGLREVMDGVVGSKDWTEDQLTDFDLDELLGKACLIELAGVEDKNGKVYQNIVGIEALPKGFKIDPIRKKISVTVDDFNDSDKLRELPAWIVEKIQKSEEYLKADATPAMTNEIKDERTFDLPEDEIKLEDVPF